MKTVSYYFTPASPWTYLGHARFVEMAKRHGATVRLRPVDLGRVFPVSGGLPLAKRAPQRQAYRLHELARWRDALGVPLTIHPKFFPVPADLAARTLIATDLGDLGHLSRLVTSRLTAERRDLRGRRKRAAWYKASESAQRKGAGGDVSSGSSGKS
jgi:2-hydroxychromene-2-carboxylate isomerase